MKTKRTLWRAIGATAIIAIIGFGVTGCDNNGTPVLHTVTFNTHGGSTVQSQAVEEGRTATRPAAPTMADYDFVGWFTAQTGGTQFNFNTPITGPTAVHAQWEPAQQIPDTHTVTFNTHGGSEVPSQEVEEGQSATRPDDPIRADYDFVGWFTAQTSGMGFNFSETPITGPITIHAQWEPAQQIPDTHTVTFNTHGGNTVQSQKVEDGETATRPPTDPIRDNHNFVNWFTDETDGTPFDFDTSITEDTTIHARWIAVHTVIFDTHSSTFPMPDQHVEHGQRATRPTTNPTRDDDEFVNWFTDETDGTPFDFDTPITEDTTIHAQWRSAPRMVWTAIPAGPGGSTFLVDDYMIFNNISGVATDGNGRWVAVGNDGRMAYSDGGINWTAIPAGPGGSTFNLTLAGPAINGVAHNGLSGAEGRWVAVGNGGRMAHSNDGINWTAIPAGGAGGSTFLPTGTGSVINGVAHNGLSGAEGRWVAVGNGGRMARSNDGINWVAISPGPNGSTFNAPGPDGTTTGSIINGVAHNGLPGVEGRWVAVGNGGRMAHSNDGINWTAIHGGAVGSTFPSGTEAGTVINGVAYGNGRWVAVGNGGRMAHSPDGINWTAIHGGAASSTFPSGTEAGTVIRGVAYGNGRWVAVGSGGRMAHSPNGINWTQIPAAPNGSTFDEVHFGWPIGISGVAYGNGRWVAVGGIGRMAYFTEE